MERSDSARTTATDLGLRDRGDVVPEFLELQICGKFIGIIVGEASAAFCWDDAMRKQCALIAVAFATWSRICSDNRGDLMLIFSFQNSGSQAATQVGHRQLEA